MVPLHCYAAVTPPYIRESALSFGKSFTVESHFILTTDRWGLELYLILQKRTLIARVGKQTGQEYSRLFFLVQFHFLKKVGTALEAEMPGDQEHCLRMECEVRRHTWLISLSYKLHIKVWKQKPQQQRRGPDTVVSGDTAIKHTDSLFSESFHYVDNSVLVFIHASILPPALNGPAVGFCKMHTYLLLLPKDQPI